MVAAGKQIYRTGHDAAGPEIMAVLGGQQGAEVTAAALPCAGCHGRDGKGRPEGGVTPSDLTWDALSRPYQLAEPGSRRHPPYDERTLKRAITLGIDAGGQALQAAMPRYRLTQEQADHLIAYIKTLGREADPGVTPDRLRLGILLPPEPEAAAVRRALDAAAARLNATGGLYARRLDLRYLPPLPQSAAMPGPESTALAASGMVALSRPELVVVRVSAPDALYRPEGAAMRTPAPAALDAADAESPQRASSPGPEAAMRALGPATLAAPEPADAEPPERVSSQGSGAADPLASGSVVPPASPAQSAAWRAAVERFLDAEQPFALVASAAAGEEAALASLAADRELPVVGALTGAPPPASSLDRYVFYLQPGLAEQARALVEAVSAGLGGVPRHAGLLIAAAQPEAVAAAARDQFDRTRVQPWAATCAPGDRQLAARIVEANQAGVDALVFIGGAQDAHDLLAGADALGWHPRVFLLAALAAGAVLDAPAAFAGRLYLAAPGLPSDLTAKGAAALLAAGLAPPSGAPAAAAPPDNQAPGTAANSGPAAQSPTATAPAPTAPATRGPASGASAGAPATQAKELPRATLYERQALAAFATFTEALTHCGRDLSRDRLIDALEGMHDFDTGLTPLLTFGPERHLGALGAYVVVFDPARGGLAPAGGWVAPR